jgi:hypothetical protein
MSHVCYEGTCATSKKRQVFSSARGLHQHWLRTHEDTPDEETTLAIARSLKRKRDADEEEDRRRRDLEVRLAFEAAHREPELPPVRVMYLL